jgi:ketosteroid isomerase-like protein
MTKLLCIAALLLLTDFPAFAQNSPSDETGRIIALEHAWKRAIEAKDTKALEQILAPTFVGVETDGSLANKSAFLASIKDPSYQPAQAIYEDIRAEIYSDTAITTGVFRIRETQKGKRVTLRQRFIDTWIKKGATWQCVASQVSPIPAK